MIKLLEWKAGGRACCLTVNEKEGKYYTLHVSVKDSMGNDCWKEVSHFSFQPISDVTTSGLIDHIPSIFGELVVGLLERNVIHDGTV